MNNPLTWTPAPLSVFASDEVCYLYALSWDAPFIDVKHCLEDLDASEKTRAATLLLAWHRTRFIIARSVLRKLLSVYTGKSAASLRFTYQAHGRPCLDERLSFNLSHTHTGVVFALIKQPMLLGVDIECIDYEHDTLGIARRFFHIKEYEALVNMPQVDRAAAFYHIWTQKEAFVKAKGVGLAYGLSSFRVKTTPNEGAGLVSLAKTESQASSWQMLSFTPFADCTGALALQSSRPVKVQGIIIDAL